MFGRIAWTVEVGETRLKMAREVESNFPWKILSISMEQNRLGSRTLYGLLLTLQFVNSELDYRENQEGGWGLNTGAWLFQDLKVTTAALQRASCRADSHLIWRHFRHCPLLRVFLWVELGWHRLKIGI